MSAVRGPSLAAIRRVLATPRRAVDPRERFVANLGSGSQLSAELRAVFDRPPRAASVLVPVLERPGGLTVLFTERAAHLKDHAGQISFPGGRIADAGETAVARSSRSGRLLLSARAAAVSV